MPRLIVCLVAAAAAFDACTQKDAQGRRPLRCCPGKPSFVVAILHGERKDGRLQQMYRPLHETLRQGLAARSSECVYQVNIARTTTRSRGVAQSLRAGDVLIWIGVHHEEQFLRQHEGGAPALAVRGVYVISYQTEFFPLVAYRGAAEVWTYTHATHFRRKAPRRYPKRVVPPGFVAPLFAPPPLADTGPARELTFFGMHRAGRECPKSERGRVPAGGAIPLKSFNNVWRAAEWARATRERRASAYITFHKHCGNAMSPLESFRLSQLLSFGALVVAEDSDAADVALYKDIILVERDFYGEWSPGTRELLADGAAILAFKQNALALYKQRFAPLALLQKVDAWNERHAPRHWLDPVSWAGACHMFPPFECNGRKILPGQVPELGAPARRRLQDAFDACAPRDGRRPLRCCPGESYTIAVMHGERNDGKLKLMYAPIRETLASGLRARMNQCGYRVTTATTLQEAGDVASRLKKGDVALWLGIHQERNFMRLAPRLAAKGVYVISYQTDYFPLKAYPGAAETWYSVWKSNFTASNVAHWLISTQVVLHARDALRQTRPAAAAARRPARLRAAAVHAAADRGRASLHAHVRRQGARWPGQALPAEVRRPPPGERRAASDEHQLGLVRRRVGARRPGAAGVGVSHVSPAVRRRAGAPRVLPTVANPELRRTGCRGELGHRRRRVIRGHYPRREKILRRLVEGDAAVTRGRRRARGVQTPRVRPLPAAVRARGVAPPRRRVERARRAGRLAGFINF